MTIVFLCTKPLCRCDMQHNDYNEATANCETQINILYQFPKGGPRAHFGMQHLGKSVSVKRVLLNIQSSGGKVYGFCLAVGIKVLCTISM